MKRASLYDPPMTGNDGQTLEELREHLLNGPDNALFFHLGHFLSWFASCEYLVTLLIHALVRLDPVAMNILVRGMDCRTKVKRLYELCDLRGVEIPPDLDARLNHLSGAMSDLRNKLVHQFPYWPEGDALQICSVGAPPSFAGTERDFPAPPPETISGLDLFERGLWLKTFAHDLGPLHMSLWHDKSFRTGGYTSSLPRGHQARKPKRPRTDRYRRRPEKRTED